MNERLINFAESPEAEEGSADDEESSGNRSRGSSADDPPLPAADKKQKKLTEFQRLKANCKSDELEKLRIKCEYLVRDCIAGLLVNLSNDDFKAMEGKASASLADL